MLKIFDSKFFPGESQLVAEHQNLFQRFFYIEIGNNKMAVASVGVDLAEIDRISDMIERYGDRFIKRVFTAGEIKYCQRKVMAAFSFAARFAAKEAVFKATGVGLNLGMHWREVEVVNDHHGRPMLKLYGEAARRMDGKALHLSLSHSGNMAIAMVVVDID